MFRCTGASANVQMHMLKPPQVGPTKDGGSRFLWNVGSYLPNYMLQHPINHNNLKSFTAMFATV
jgi:hypothetical protein